MKNFRNPLLIFVLSCAGALAACSPSAVSAPVETIDLNAAAAQVENAPEPKVTRPASHTVSAGETLIEIATNYGLDYRELALWNGISEPDKILAGEELRLSAPAAAPAAKAIKKVQTPAVTKTPVISAAPSPVPLPSTLQPSPTPEAGGRDISNLPIKNAPVATKYAYARGTLSKLRRAQQNAPANTATQPSPTIKATRPPAATLSAPAPTASTAPKPPVLVAQRRRFGVDWSWPSAGKVLETFTERTKGINFAGDIGDAIYASADGKVVYVGTGVKSYGRLVIIKHGNDYLSAYAHNQSVLVREGAQVKRGEQISTLGDSGAASPMLHFEIRKAGKPFNPLQVLPKRK